MEERFIKIIQNESLESVISILAEKQRTEKLCKLKLNSNVQSNYRQIYKASKAIQDMADVLSKTSADLSAVMGKMETLDNISLSCPEFESLAVSLKDNLSESLLTIWVGNDQMTIAPVIDVRNWIKQCELLTQSLISGLTNSSAISAGLLNCLQLVKFDEEAIDKSRLSRFSRIVNMLVGSEDIRQKILIGYSDYAKHKYVNPIAHYLDSNPPVSSSCCIVLYSLIKTQIMLDLEKIHSAMPQVLATEFESEILVIIDQLICTHLFSVCINAASTTSASLKLLFTVNEGLHSILPISQFFYNKITSQTITKLVYYVFKQKAWAFFMDLVDSTKDLSEEICSDLMDSASAIQRFMLMCCSSSDQRLLVGANLYVYFKLFWVGCFIIGSDSASSIEETLTEEVRSLEVESLRTAHGTRPCGGITADSLIATSVLRNMLEFCEQLKQQAAGYIASSWSNKKRAVFLDVLETLGKVEEYARLESCKFGLDNWSCSNLNICVRRMTLQMKNSICDLLTDHLYQLLRDQVYADYASGFECLERTVIEQAVAHISQVHYFINATPSPTNEQAVSGIQLQLLEYMKNAQDEYSSLKIEAMVRSKQDIELLAYRECGQRWRESVALTAVLRALARIAEEGFHTKLDELGTSSMIWVVLRTTNYVLPSERTGKNQECLAYLTGLLFNVSDVFAWSRFRYMKSTPHAQDPLINFWPMLLIVTKHEMSIQSKN